LARGGLLEHAHAAELRVELLRRLLADVTGVEDDEVGILRLRGLGEAFGRKHVRHTMGIVDVHLAAEGLDVDFARCAHADSVGLRRPPPAHAAVSFNGLIWLANLARSGSRADRPVLTGFGAKRKWVWDDRFRQRPGCAGASPARGYRRRRSPSTIYRSRT